MGSHQLTSLVELPEPTNSSDDYTVAQIYGFIACGIDILVCPLGAVIAAVTYRWLREDKEGSDADQLAMIFD